MYLPGTIPMTANAALQVHWSQRQKQRKRYTALIIEQIGFGPWHGLNTVPATKCHCRIEVGRPRQLQDPDNRVASVKSILDALRHAGWVYQDSDKWLDLEVHEVKADRPGYTLIQMRRAE